MGSDGDGCDDGGEAVSFNEQRIVNSGDQLIPAVSFLRTDRANIDVDKNGVAKIIDLADPRKPHSRGWVAPPG
jgi:hypothetical protein